MEAILDDLVGRPLCRWCACELYEGKTRHQWHHFLTGSRVCFGQMHVHWADKTRAEPTEWAVAE